MTVTFATISGAFVNPAFGGNRERVTITATTDGGRLTVDDKVIRGSYTVPINADGTATVTLPKLPQTGLSPAGATWRIWFSRTEFFDFLLSADTTWAALVPTSTGTVTPSVLSDAQAARDAAIAAEVAAQTAAAGVIIGTLNVKGYGALGNGVADDTAAIQAAIDAAGTFPTGLVDVIVPVGTYMISGTLNVKTNVRLRGSKGGTIIKSTAGAASADVVRIIGDSDSWLEDLTVDANNRATSIAVNFSPTSGTGTRVGMRGVRILNASASNAVRWTSGKLCRGLTIEGCTIDTCTNGISVYSFTGQVQQDVRIVNNTLTNVGTNNIQIVGNNLHEFSGVVIADNRLHDFQNVGAFGPIPIEVGYCDQVTIARNTIGPGGTRGISTGHNTNMSIEYNSIKGQSAYAIELNVAQTFAITGNVIENCATWINETGAQASDGTISGNTFIGTGLAATLSTGDGIKLAMGAKRVRISGNTFSDWQYLRDAIRVGETNASEDVVVEGNTFIINDANTPVQTISMRKCIRSSLRNNSVRVKRNLIAGDDTSDLFQITLDAASADITVESNEFIYASGLTFTSTPNHAAIGHGSTGAAALPGLMVRRNRVTRGNRGLRLSSVSSADQIIEDNDTRTCTVADSFNAALVIKRTFRLVEATAAPTAGTWLRGDKAVNLTATVGSPKGWVCTVAGTPGTWVSEGNL